jgi:hypothetical protein
MAVQARFYVRTITKHAHLGKGAGVVEMGPVSRGPENKQWASATPSGSVTMTIGNPAALEWFADRLGKEVALTFEDRPVVCARCHQEIPLAGQYAADEVDSEGRPVHRECPE